MFEKAQQVALQYRITLRVNPKFLYLNKNLAGGRFTKGFSLVDWSGRSGQLEDHVLRWLHDYGPLLEEAQGRAISMRRENPDGLRRERPPDAVDRSLPD